MDKSFNFNRTIKFNIFVSYEDIKERIFNQWDYVKTTSEDDKLDYYFNNSDTVLRWCDVGRLICDLIDDTVYITEKVIPNYNKEFYNTLNNYIIYITPILLEEWKERF